MQATKVLALSALAASALANPHVIMTEELKPLWSTWKAVHDKQYTFAGEENARFNIFVENYQKVVASNAENNGVKYALNKFADLTGEEFKAIYTGGYKYTPREEVKSDFEIDYEVLSLPSTVDWRQKGAVSDVKDQGQCGSCWAFSTTGALEGLYFITSGKLESFSEQQIVDCDTASGDQGCNGGLPENAFGYTAAKGIETEADYPYTAADGTCKYNASKAIHVNKGSKEITPKKAAALRAAIVTQPVSIGIEADQQIFQFYSSGVIKGDQCGDELDHAVLAVGYTTVNGEQAFIVKNSWGSSWGDDGYVYISTNGKVNGKNGVCGILADPVVPTA